MTGRLLLYSICFRMFLDNHRNLNMEFLLLNVNMPQRQKISVFLFSLMLLFLIFLIVVLSIVLDFIKTERNSKSSLKTYSKRVVVLTCTIATSNSENFIRCCFRSTWYHNWLQRLCFIIFLPPNHTK